MPKAAKVKVTEKAIHPRSRKASQMIKNAHRRDKSDKRKTERTVLLQTLAEKVQWFKDCINADEEKTQYSTQDIHNMIDVYFKRFDKELELLQLGNNIKGRQLLGGARFSKEHTIKTMLEKEQQIYKSTGIEIPDLTTIVNVKLLRAWDGNFNYLPKIKLRRFCSLENAESKPDNEKESLVMGEEQDTSLCNK